MIVTVDRIEGDVVVLDVDGVTVPWPRTSLPAAKEGDRLEVTFAPAGDEAERRADAEARLARLRKRSPKGDDIDL